jgi:glycosyltransferase involved in cell wall biosynthesis
VTQPPPLRVARVIARLNVGGPAHHVALLTARLDAARFQTQLLAGRPSAREAEFTTVIERSGVVPVEITHLGPAVAPLADLRAFAELVRRLRRMKPDLVHTHTAKAGALGRLAALTVRPRPIIVHTYHGHVLEGYFGRPLTAAYRLVERLLARVSDQLVAVSEQTVDDLVRLRVAPRARFTVIPIGLDLGPLLALPAAPDGAARAGLGLAEDDIVLAFVGRLVAIKRLDVLLHALALALPDAPQLRLLVVGDGELRGEHETLAAKLRISDRVLFLGFRFDLETIASVTDVAVLCSDNEGTPVALIEAGAAARPSIATDVGGVSEIVGPDTGRLVPARDPRALADALVALARDAPLRRTLGDAAREKVAASYQADRLVADITRLYGTLVAARARR